MSLNVVIGYEHTILNQGVKPRGGRMLSVLNQPGNILVRKPCDLHRSIMVLFLMIEHGGNERGAAHLFAFTIEGKPIHLDLSCVASRSPAPGTPAPEPIAQILAHIGEPISPPLLHPARGPPQTEGDAPR